MSVHAHGSSSQHDTSKVATLNSSRKRRSMQSSMHFIPIFFCIGLTYFIAAAAAAEPSNATAPDSFYALCWFSQILRACKTCSDTKRIFISVYTITYTTDSAGEGSDGGPDGVAIIWAANTTRPVLINSTVELGQDGNLVLRDAAGSVTWESNTAGLRVHEPGNFIFFKERKKVVWKSFSSPTNSLIEQNDPTQGCSLDIPPVCSNQSELIELQYWAYLLAASESPPFFIDKCKSSCLNNCSCKALAFYPDKNQCFQFLEIFTMWSALFMNATSHDRSNPVAFIKIEPPNPPLPKPSRYGHWSPASITILTLLAVAIVTLLALITLHRKQRMMNHSSKQASEIFVPSIPNLPKNFDYQKLCQITGNFTTKVGKGGFGTVFGGNLSDGTKVAVKCLGTAPEGMKQFEAEVMTIGSIHHKNLVKLLGFGAEKSHYYLIYEFVPNLSLDKWLFNEEDHVLDWEKRFNIVIDIAKGLHYLHEGCQERVLHLDIKPQNILLDSSFRAKICDFGLAKFIDRGKSYIDTTVRGTPGYMAPEWLSSRVTEKTDVYSFGIVLLEIVSGQKTVSIPTGLSSQNMVRAKAFEQEETLLQHVDMRHDMGKLDIEQVKKITRVGLVCIHEDPSQRPSMGRVVKMLEGSLQVPLVSNTSLLQLNGSASTVVHSA